MTAEEVTKAIQDREIYLADKKKQNDEYKAQKAANTTGGFPTAAPTAPVVNKAGFQF